MENDDIEHTGRLILASKYVVGLTGAGISMESGIRFLHFSEMNGKN